VKPLAPLVHVWSRYVPDRGLDAHGHFLQAAPETPGVLVDPVPFNEGDAAQAEALGGVAGVVVTRPDARRLAEAGRCRDVFGCPLFVPAGMPGAGETRAHQPLLPGTALPGGLLVAAPPEAAGPPPGWPLVVPLFHPPSGSALAGGAVTGAPAGRLSLDLPPDSAPAAAAGAARGLRSLLAFWLRRVLTGAGEPVLRDADGALQELVYRHDPAASILRRDELVWQPLRGQGNRFLRRSAECSRPLALRTLDFELTAVPPGRQNTLLHRHDGVEEAFLVVEGEGELLTEAGAFPIRAGDVLGFPPRYPVAHAVRNTGDAELRFFAFGALAEPADAVGLCEYPESNKQFQFVPGRPRRFYLPEEQDVDYWAGERVDEPGPDPARAARRVASGPVGGGRPPRP